MLGHAVPVPVPQMLGPFPVAACGRWLCGSWADATAEEGGTFCLSLDEGMGNSGGDATKGEPAVPRCWMKDTSCSAP